MADITWPPFSSSAIVVPTAEGLGQAEIIAKSRRAMMYAVQGHIPQDRLEQFADLLEESIAAVNIEGAKVLRRTRGRR